MEEVKVDAESQVKLLCAQLLSLLLTLPSALLHKTLSFFSNEVLLQSLQAPCSLFLSLRVCFPAFISLNPTSHASFSPISVFSSHPRPASPSYSHVHIDTRACLRPAGCTCAPSFGLAAAQVAAVESWKCSSCLIQRWAT